MATVRRLDIASADDQDARVSVSMVRFHSPAQAHGVYSELQRTGIHVLPCQQFYWAQPQEGSASLRIALARDFEFFDAGLRRLEQATLEKSRAKVPGLA
jgi:aspartate/methionine/tyrosine aminotransferase